MNQHLGSDLDDLLRDEGLLEEVTALATKRVLALQIATTMARQGLSKAALARRMQTSRAALDRLLDPDCPGVTLLTLTRAAAALGQELRVELAPAVSRDLATGAECRRPPASGLPPSPPNPTRLS